MAEAEPEVVAQQRSSLKSQASTVAKYNKALHLEISTKDEINVPRVRTLYSEANKAWMEYDALVSDLSAYSEIDQADVRASHTRLKNEFAALQPRLQEIVDMEGSIPAPTSKASSRSSKRRQLAEQKLQQLRRLQDLERQQQELQRNVELQIAQDEVDNAALEDSDSGSSQTGSDGRPGDTGLPVTSLQDKVADYVRSISVNDVKQSQLNPEAVPFSLDGSRPNLDVLAGFKQFTDSVQETLHLPKPELLTFSGNPSDYCKFISNFETNLESRVRDDRLRLSYLIQFCEGDARKSIEDCVVLPSDQGFARAKAILASRYGKPHLIARSHVDRLVNGGPIKSNDVQSLMNLSLDMEKCQITLSQIGFVSDIDNTENLRKIVRRLPMHLRSKWAERASALIENSSEPRFNDLLKFVQSRVLVANTMYGQDLSFDPRQKVSSGSSKVKPNSFKNSASRGISLNTTGTLGGNKSASGESSYRPLSCVHCKGSHRLVNCEKFKLLELSEKLRIVRKFRMCENCLNFKHSATNCRKGSCCDVQGCREKHHTMLHEQKMHEQAKSMEQHVQSNCCAAAGENPLKHKVSLRIVPVKVKQGKKCVQTYALLDDGSDVTLCSDSLVQKLGAKGTPRDFTITTVNQASQRRNGLELQLEVSSMDGLETVAINRVWTVERLPVSVASLPDHRELGKWTHLAGISLPRIDRGEVELLIGGDTPEAFWVEEERRGGRGDPYAVRSPLGWSVIGPTGTLSTSAKASVNFQQTLSTEEQLERLWETDFPECRSDIATGMSHDDRKALSMMENSIQLDNGHYKLGLPWRDPNVQLPNNKAMAAKRLSQLKRKLDGDEQLCKKYTETMDGYLKNGYAIQCQGNPVNDPRVWYLPHHPVMNVNKPGKLRVVFDCAAQYKGTTLNENLLQGPDLVNSIVGVLMRFRQEPVAMVADIEAMFHQVKVSESDRNALRFLWWPDGDTGQDPSEYCMGVHLFGATSSPSCAAYSLQRTARDNSMKFSEETVKTVERNFYVDDLLKSVTDAKVGIQLSRELREMLSLGGFRLAKWMSNNKEVMDSIPVTERADISTNVDLENDPPMERALGIHWNVEKDKFVFDVKLQEKQVTRRGILSVASTLYDPLGLVAPVTLIPKLVLQNACRQKLQWDDAIVPEDAEKWTDWIQNLSALSRVDIDRCVKPANIDPTTTKAELHMFSDASQVAYGAAVYLKIYDVNGSSKCSLIMGKSRLAPIKTMSIPRLELAAAVLAVKLYQLVSHELDIKIDNRYFWTDSMIVLGYVRNDTKRFKTYVANRLATIRDVTSPDEWRYVPSRLNPGDLASRGLHPSDTNRLAYWLHGPEFLLKDESQWPEITNSVVVSDDDVELKLSTTANVTQGERSTGLNDLLGRYSNFGKLQRAVAWLLRYKRYLVAKYLYARKSRNKQEVFDKQLTVCEMREANNAILELVQRSCFGNEIMQVKTVGHVSESSSIAKLSPIHTEGLLRVGGRLDNADISEHSKHQVILPSDHHVTKLIVRQYHTTNAHVGPQHVLSLIRRRYWIVHGLKTVKSVLSRCIVCKRQRPRPETQMMGQLPAERLSADKPPFTYVGVDYFGPMYVKSGRKQLKRYGCLFTCLTTRAVHIEIAHSLDQDSFLCALQRFMSRRGRAEKIFSDNGSNFTSGERELRESIQQWNQENLKKGLHQQEIAWHFNPPYASHMGGVWERMVRSTKSALKSVLREQTLNDEALLTLITEVEKILNDRPITQVSTDSRDPEPLSPNNLLLMRPNPSVPLGVFKRGDNYYKRWWKQVQYLAGIFWRRWKGEYLPTLQCRQKWQNVQRNVAVNDLVLVCDEPSAKGHWPLGLVLEVSRGRDGLVRSCKVRVNGTTKVRPITKLCVLEENLS